MDDPSDTVGPEGSTWSSAVLIAKLRPAVTPEYLVLRPRLLSLVGDLVAAPLTLVVAPAGSGKTSLLSSWVEHTKMPTAWLSLDETDRDPVSLWLGVMAAIEGIAPGCADRPAALLRQPGRLAQAVGAFLDNLESRAYEPRVLIIDDLQLVDEVDAISSSLALFVQHLPAWLHVVVSTRRTPHLPIHRLRARGQLSEVHFTELRFSLEEATAMLRRIAPTLPPDELADVAARAGGWAASIQLAALAARSDRAQRSADLAAPDDTSYLEDYVWQEVLANEREDVVDTLLATAVVARIDPRLAQALSGRPDAPELLALAEARGLFTTRIEPLGAYEVHRLVREVLVSHTASRDPDRIDDLHRRAAEWYEAAGETAPALEHWLRAGRPREALRLLSAEAAALSDSGRESTILSTITAIPAGVAATDIAAMLEYAWCHLLVDRRRFLQAVDQATAWARSDQDLDATNEARLLVLRAIASTIRSNWAESAPWLEQALAQLGPRWVVDPIGKFAWNMIARDIALSERWDETSAEVRTVQHALSIAPERRLAFEGIRALGLALAGQPVDALRVVAGARKASEVTNMTILRTELAVAEALATRELGDASQALPQLVEISRTRVEPLPYASLITCLQLVHLRLDAGDLDAAGEDFDRAMEMVDTALPGTGARDWLARTGTSVALAAGDVNQARVWAHQVVDPFWSGLCTAKVLLATDDAAAAGDALLAVEPRCVRHQVLRALLLSSCTTDAEAVERHLTEVVRLSVEHGLVQTIASEGPHVVESIERLAWRAPESWLNRLRRAAVPDPVGRNGRTIELMESLTDRELEVLRLLPSRLTLREIADELFISLNTLKFHLKVIYRKLGCSSRAEAAEMARALTSLHRPRQPSTARRR